MTQNIEQLKAQILELTREYSRQVHGMNRPGNDANRPPFIAGKSSVAYAGRVFTEDEVEAAVSSTLDFWLTLGKEGAAFEAELASLLGIKATLLINSGSSANLIALSTLTSPLIDANRRLRTGDEVITCAAGFPTTVAPIIQNGCIPVFADSDVHTGNINVEQLESAFTEGKTKAIMIAHTLGNPFDLATVLQFCKKHHLWLIEDNCDALGCTYTMPKQLANDLGFTKNSPGLDAGEDFIIRYTGSWGDISTQSFYPPHHLTMGEGGAVNIVNSMKLKRIAESFRDWGRDCWCPSGQDNTCGKRFDWQLGELPDGYDHKYIYSHLGYNLKPLDIQAAIGRVQLKRLPEFINTRKQNWEYLRRGLANLEEFFDFSLPTHATSWSLSGFTWDESGCQTDCSWFGFLLLVKPTAPFSNSLLARHLDNLKIGNRMLFGGNLLKQPVMVQLKQESPDKIKIAGEMTGADILMNQGLFLGTYPGLTQAMLDYEIEQIQQFVKSY